MTFIIVGGPHDGQRVTLQEGLPELVLVCEAPVEIEDNPSSSGCPISEDVSYIRTSVNLGSTVFTFYRYNKLADHSALLCLLNGYQRSPSSVTMLNKETDDDAQT